MPARQGRAVFIVPHSRLGACGAFGGPTGRRYTIPATGDWVHQDDETFIMNLIKHPPCCPEGITAFHYGVPSRRDMKRVPAWAFAPALTGPVRKTKVLPEDEGLPAEPPLSTPRRTYRPKRSRPKK